MKNHAIFYAMATLVFTMPGMDAMAQARGRTGPGAMAEPEQARFPVLKIRITIAGRAVIASLEDNPTSRAFAARLPLTLTLSDHAATEKIGDVPGRLDVTGAPRGYAPRQGDIAYYAPWGNLALFHKDFRYSEGLIKLGRFESGVEILRAAGPVRATIELVGASAN